LCLQLSPPPISPPHPPPNREVIETKLDIHCQRLCGAAEDRLEDRLAGRAAQLAAMQAAMDGGVRAVLKRALAQRQAELQARLAQSEQQVGAKEQLIESFKKNQSETFRAAKEVLVWAGSCCGDVLAISGVAPAAPASSFDTIPESLYYLRDQVDAALDTLRRANEGLKADLRQTHDSLLAARKAQARLEAELGEHRAGGGFPDPSAAAAAAANGHGRAQPALSTPRHRGGSAKVNFSATTPLAHETALAVAANTPSAFNGTKQIYAYIHIYIIYNIYVCYIYICFH
jgi:hypothetical protein